MKKRALVSVYDKTGILEFCKNLEELGYEIVSTGGTFTHLKDGGLNPIEISEVTNFPEILNGRVKTLNPLIHGGILFRRELEDHQKTIEENKIHPIEMVVNTLYPFEEKLRTGADHEEMVENIDIGGPSMIRAAAKNYKDVFIVTSPRDYQRVLEGIKEDKDLEELRKDLARKAFSYTAHYDSLISNYFNREMGVDFPEYLTKGFSLSGELRYGENPHQRAAFYKDSFNGDDFSFKKLQGKDLSYNNLNDIYKTVSSLKDFKEPTCVCVKHTNPCGIGSSSDIYDAYMKAYECDKESIFGGIIAVNREVNEEIAKHMASFFLEVVIGPSFSKEALEILSTKKNLRLIEIEDLNEFSLNKLTYKEVLGGMIYQEKDSLNEIEEETFDFEVVTKRKPSKEELEELKFAWKCAKTIASNGVVISKDNQSLGIGQGEVRRSWAVEEAIHRAQGKLEGAVLASDAFFFEDTVEEINKTPIKTLVSPGGSIKDKDVIDLCDKYDIALVFTGIRHFRH